VTSTVRAPVRPATLWRCVVSRALATLSAGSMGVSRRAPRRAYPDGTRAEAAWGARPAEASPSFPVPEGRLTRATGLRLARMSAGAFSIERTLMGGADASYAAALVLAALVVSIPAGAIRRRSRTPRRTPSPKSLGSWPSLEFTRRQLPHGGRFSNNHDNSY
jgi:hypothetical protein